MFYFHFYIFWLGFDKAAVILYLKVYNLRRVAENILKADIDNIESHNTCKWQGYLFVWHYRSTQFCPSETKEI